MNLYRDYFERLLPRWSLNNSLNPKDAKLAGSWFLFFKWYLCCTLLGIVFRSGEIVVGCLGVIFCLGVAGPLAMGRGLPGMLAVAALGDIAGRFGCFRRRRFPRLRPASYVHGLYALTGLLGFAVVILGASPMWLLLYFRIHYSIVPSLTNFELLVRIAWLSISMLHMAVTGYCLSWSEGAEGKNVYLGLHVVTILVGCHIPFVMLESDFKRQWEVYLEGGCMGWCTILASTLYWRGWHIKRPSRAELLRCLAAPVPELPAPSGK